MKRLKLELDSLSVESFAIAGGTRTGAGTVKARESAEDTVYGCTVYGCNITHNNSCDFCPDPGLTLQNCGNTGGGVATMPQNNTCADTCGFSCRAYECQAYWTKGYPIGACVPA